MTQRRHLAYVILTYYVNYVLSNFIFIFWQENVFVINCSQHYRWQYLSWIQIVLRLLSQNHLMFSFFNFSRMDATSFFYWRIDQFWLFLINLFNRRRSSNLCCYFHNIMRQLSLLFYNILINYRLHRLINDRILLALFRVVITLIYPIIIPNTLRNIRTCSILNDIITQHVRPSTLNKCMWRWSAKNVIFIAIYSCSISSNFILCNCNVNFIFFQWDLNRVSRALFAYWAGWSRFLLLYQQWNIDSLVWLHDTEVGWSLAIAVTDVTFGNVNDDVTLDLIFFFGEDWVCDVYEILANSHEFLLFGYDEEVFGLFDEFHL